MVDEGEEVVRAAGGIVVRRADGGDIDVALVHRPAYDDWSFPKGKRAAGDRDDRQTARREVEEETGLLCRLDRPVGTIEYRDRKNRPKSVVYWLMRPIGGMFRPTDEVDEMRWVPIGQAGDLLTYEHDRALLKTAARLLELPSSRPR
jgi:8-oxo-dGTP pyrophosphatase MutT (NUDIX family)